MLTCCSLRPVFKYFFIDVLYNTQFFSLLSSLVTLDLSDEDGDIKNLHEFPTHYAHRFLKGREVFVLIKVESRCLINCSNSKEQISGFRRGGGGGGRGVEKEKGEEGGKLPVKTTLSSKVFLILNFFAEGQGDQPTTYTALLNDLEISNPKLLGK